MPPSEQELHDAGWRQDREAGFSGLIGPLWRRGDGEVLTFGLQTGPEHQNMAGSIHGGAILALADHALGMSVPAGLENGQRVTVQLDMQFIAAAYPGDFLVARAMVRSETRSLLFMAGTIEVGDKLVASTSGVWKKRRPSPGLHILERGFHQAKL